MDLVNAFEGQYRLQRWPARPDERLRAWDAADEYVVQHLAAESLQCPRTLIVNDQFGALTLCLNQLSPVNWGDSFIAHSAASHNLALNGIDSQFTALPSTEIPDGTFELVIIKVPKSNALLEYQLQIISTLVEPDTVIIAAGMAKHIHSSTLALFEKYLGPTRTSLAVKKARLIFSQCSNDSIVTQMPTPTQYYQQDLGLTLSNHANVFSRDRLDIGARFMIEQFNGLPKAHHIVDLACGNGVLGIMAKRQLPESKLSFIDESYMAVASASSNYKAQYSDNSGDFIVDDCLSHSQLHNVDLILCNPPFHQQHSIGDETAWRMFNQSRKALGKGGELWVVGNRHMNYHSKLKRVFGNCRLLASNKKFTVLSSLAT